MYQSELISFIHMWVRGARTSQHATGGCGCSPRALRLLGGGASAGSLRTDSVSSTSTHPGGSMEATRVSVPRRSRLATASSAATRHGF
jgi:hypothetical protein